MKKIIFLLLGLFLISGCSFSQSNLTNANIYTTTYPISYIMNYLYGENSTITSIYPNGVELDNYSLTDKQIEDYAKSDLFVYMGVGREKEFAKSFINKNNKILIIDATYGLSYKENIKELWLAPNNFLMLLKNIKTTLNEYLDNKVSEEAVTQKYDELYAKVSWIDAELRNVAKESYDKNNNTLVVSSNSLKYLESYGFIVISLEDIEQSGSENAINDIKSKFKSGKYSTILKLTSDKETDLIADLTKNNKANIITINDMITNSDPASDYISIQNENIALIRNLLLD